MLLTFSTVSLIISIIIRLGLNVLAIKDVIAESISGQIDFFLGIKMTLETSLFLIIQILEVWLPKNTKFIITF